LNAAHYLVLIKQAVVRSIVGRPSIIMSGLAVVTICGTSAWILPASSPAFDTPRPVQATSRWHKPWTLPPNSLSLSSPVPITREMIGVNTSGWAPWAVTQAGQQLVENMGIGTEQFPNSPWIYNWHTNQSLNDPASGTWYNIPVSISQWAQSLIATGTKGLYIIPYGYNPTGTGPETISDVQDLVRTIVANHWPIDALVIGSEEFGAWTSATNLWQNHTALQYALAAKQMAEAIHAIDPSMLVGVDLAMPWSIPAPPNDTVDPAWNRTILSIDAPYINFLSVHYYPVPQVITNSALLQALPILIAEGMSYVRDQVNKYIPPDVARPKIWVTEYNPYAVPSAQTTAPIYGPALVESYLAFLSDGATQVDYWSLYGSAVESQPVGSSLHNTPMAPSNATAFSVTGLASNGTGPQPPVNTLYPSGQALSILTRLIAPGAQLQIVKGMLSRSGIFAAVIKSSQGAHWILINTRTQAAHISLGTTSQTLPPTSLSVVSSGTTALPRASAVLGEPVVTSASWDPILRQVTINGWNFATMPITSPACQSGVDQSVLAIKDVTTNTQYGWMNPGRVDNCYGFTIERWDPTQIQLILDGPAPAAADSLEVQVWQSYSGLTINTQSISLQVRYPAWWQTSAKVDAATFDPATGMFTIKGSGFNSLPPLENAPKGGYDQQVIQIIAPSTNECWGLHLGAVDNYYGLTDISWTDNTIQFALYMPPYPKTPFDLIWEPTGQTFSVTPTESISPSRN
jgi:hypothetical protein